MATAGRGAPHGYPHHGSRGKVLVASARLYAPVASFLHARLRENLRGQPLGDRQQRTACVIQPSAMNKPTSFGPASVGVSSSFGIVLRTLPDAPAQPRDEPVLLAVSPGRMSSACLCSCPTQIASGFGRGDLELGGDDDEEVTPFRAVVDTPIWSAGGVRFYRSWLSGVCWRGQFIRSHVPPVRWHDAERNRPSFIFEADRDPSHR